MSFDFPRLYSYRNTKVCRWEYYQQVFCRRSPEVKSGNTNLTDISLRVPVLRFSRKLRSLVCFLSRSMPAVSSGCSVAPVTALTWQDSATAGRCLIKLGRCKVLHIQSKHTNRSCGRTGYNGQRSQTRPTLTNRCDAEIEGIAEICRYNMKNCVRPAGMTA